MVSQKYVPASKRCLLCNAEYHRPQTNRRQDWEDRKFCSFSCAAKSKRKRPVRPRVEDDPLYGCWRHMVSRCVNQGDKDYPRYGGRGISVHPTWRGSAGFKNFAAHIGPRPSANHSIDRINNNGNYEPGNVRWATALAQGRNKRNNMLVEIDGLQKTVSDAARDAGLKMATVWSRIKESGWTPERAVTEPLHNKRKASAPKEQS